MKNLLFLIFMGKPGAVLYYYERYFKIYFILYRIEPVILIYIVIILFILYIQSASLGYPSIGSGLGDCGLVGTAAAKLGLVAGTSLSQNVVITVFNIQNSKHSYPNIDSIPSPDETNFNFNFIVNSPLEEDIPLFDFLDSMLTLNVLELLLIILIFIVLNNNYFRKLILNIIKILIVKYVPVKYVKIHKLVYKLVLNNEINYKSVIAVYLVLLLCIKLMNIYFISYLNTNIDDFILVYNHIKKSNLLLLFVPVPQKNNNKSLATRNKIKIILKKIYNKIPDWIKLVLKLLFIIITVLKLLGYSIISDVLMDNNFLIKLTYIYCTLVIIYQILNLYLIHKFITKKVKISEVLPDFLIKWLQEFEIIARDKICIREIKKDTYIQISIYILTMVLITLIS